MSIVVEWDNILLAEADRSRVMLARVAADATDAIGTGLAEAPVELLLCADPVEVDVGALAVEVDDALAHASSALSERVVEVPGGGYYELKNAGAREARGDVVVFLDSDVIPEPGWLSALVEPLSDPEVDVVAGNSYIEPSGLYGKTFALAWFFPLRSEKAFSRPTFTFWANNVAFRRAVAERFPFPAIEGAPRCACWRLAHDLAEHGVRVVLTTSAQVSHPPPNGLWRFLTRAIAHGRDRVLEARVYGSRRTASPVGTAERLWRDLRRSTGSLTRDAEHVGLAKRAIPVAFGISTSYYLLASMGELATMVSPGVMARHFRS